MKFIEDWNTLGMEMLRRRPAAGEPDFEGPDVDDCVPRDDDFVSDEVIQDYVITAEFPLSFYEDDEPSVEQDAAADKGEAPEAEPMQQV